MKEIKTQREADPSPVPEEESRLADYAQNIGRILQKYPKVQSNSPELYILSYLENLGSRKV